jgi:hypothetical protein
MMINTVLMKENTAVTKVNTIMTKENTDMTKVSRVLAKENTLLTKVNKVLMKVNTVLTKDNTVLKKVNCKDNIATRKQKLTTQATSRKQIPNRNIRNMTANFAHTSGQLRAKLPVFCKHAARTII